MPAAPLVERTELVNNIWNKLKELGVELNVTHYNTLLNVYIQNEHVFSPSEFLANMEAENVEPNQETYQGLIAAYCSEGDIDGASKILGFMKSKNFPITEYVFNCLIKGHARAGDMESAKNVLTIMQDAGMQPRWSTHLALLNAYAWRGDIESINQILSNREIKIPEKHLTSVILALAKSGYTQYIPNVLEHLPDSMPILQDIINLCLALLSQGHVDAALLVVKQLKALPPPRKETDFQPGEFFLHQCVSLNMPASVLMKSADELEAADMVKEPQEFLLKRALMESNSDLFMELVKSVTDSGKPLRPRVFRPVISHLLNKKDLPGLIQMLRTMKSIGVDVELDSLTKCLPWIFSEANSDQAILQDKECLEDLQSVCQSSVRVGFLTGNLRRVHSLLSSLPTPMPMDRSVKSALAFTITRSQDAELLAEITGLLCEDGSDSKDSSTPTDARDFVGYFLYYLIDRMSDSEAQAMEEHLRQYFHQLKETGQTIDDKRYRGIQKLLKVKGVEQLNEPLKKLVKSVDRLEGEPVERIAALEEELANQEKENQPIQKTLLKLIAYLQASKDLPKALQLKSKYGDSFSFNMYMKLLGMCCEENNPQEALNLKKEIDQKGFTAVPTSRKYVALLKVLTENGLIEDAINILKEMQEKDVPLTGYATDNFFHILNNLAVKGDVQGVNLIHQYGVMLGLIAPNSRTCSPLVLVHLRKDDLNSAVNAISECHAKYKCLPMLHDCLSTLVERGETDLLREAMDRASEFMGEQSMLHELFFAFLRAGKYSEAEQIAKTPGLRASASKLRWFMDRCQRANEVELLEKTVEMSKNIFGSDREEMYFHLFTIYDKNNDIEKAKIALEKFKEENILTKETTLNPLRSLFKRNKENINDYMKIPDQVELLEKSLEMSKNMSGSDREDLYFQLFTIYDKNNDIEKAKIALKKFKEENILTKETTLNPLRSLFKRNKENINDYVKLTPLESSEYDQPKSSSTSGSFRSINNLCKEGKVTEAFTEFQKAKQNNVRLSTRTINNLKKALEKEGLVEEAADVETFAKDHVQDYSTSRKGGNLLIQEQVRRDCLKDALVTLQTTLENGKKPMSVTLQRLVTALALNGDVQGLEKIKELSEQHHALDRRLLNVGLNTRMALAHLKNGNLEEGISIMESSCINEPKRTHTSFLFNALLTNNMEEAVEKSSILVERLANQFANYTPALDLFINYIKHGREEAARELLERCSAIAEQRGRLYRFIARSMEIKEEEKAIRLANILNDPFYKQVIYNIKMNDNATNKDVDAAVALYEQAKAEQVDPQELFLKQLAVLLREAGKPVPFSEPPESIEYYVERLKKQRSEDNEEQQKEE